MDARERLRLYLEQRRDMGETDLVLDGLAVDEVLRLVGAPVTSGTPTPPRGTVTRARAAEVGDDSIPARGTDVPGVAEGDWRKALGRDATPKEDGRGIAEAVPAASTPSPAPASPPATPVAPSKAESTEPTGAPIVVGTSERTRFGGPVDDARTLDDIAALVRACAACGLAAGARNPVPGEGNPDADFVLVGEAPGEQEDESGRPFVGASGKLLTKILEAIKLSREEVYICNVIKHRPPQNRNPTPGEIAACSPFLRRQIEMLRPKVIVTLGAFAAQTLLDTKTPIGKLRGLVHSYHGVPLVATYHPAALLRNPNWKRPTWEDVQLARRILDRARSA